MATELVLLGTAGAPMPVPGRMGISSALIVDERVFVVDCGRGSPSAFAGAGLDFTRLEAVFLTHLHADHIGDLPGMLLYPWGVRAGDNGPLAPIRVYGPSRPSALPAGDAVFHRQTTICPELPAPGPVSRDCVQVQTLCFHSEQPAWLWCLTRDPGGDWFSRRMRMLPGRYDRGLFDG